MSEDLMSIEELNKFINSGLIIITEDGRKIINFNALTDKEFEDFIMQPKICDCNKICKHILNGMQKIIDNR